ncbi:ABC transporter permease [Actinophytocola sediminis]
MLVVLIGGAVVAKLAGDTDAIDVDEVLRAPSAQHWFGTDSAGRDVLVRTLASGAADLPIALGGTVIALVAGTFLGLLAGTRSRFAEPIMRLVDGFQAFPLLILILAIVQVSGGGTIVLIVTIAVLNMPRFIRLTRSEALHIRESKYVFFADVIGASKIHVLRRHILPNVSGAVFSQASVGGALALGAIGAMSFLGLGIAPPTPSWGAMVQSGVTGITNGQWWPVLFPSLALVWAIVAFNLIADSLDTHFAREIQ